MSLKSNTVRFGAVIAAVLTIGIGSITGANAITMVDFTGSTSSGLSLLFADGMITATEGGVAGPAGPAVNVYQTSNDGLGVVNKIIDDNSPGGTEGHEFLVFKFNTNVTLGSWLFSESAGSLDSFDVYIDGTNIDVVGILGNDKIRSLGTCNIGAINERCLVDLSGLGSGMEFAFTDGSGQDGGDDYSVAKIEYNLERTRVSEPGTLALLGLGLAGLGFARRKRII